MRLIREQLAGGGDPLAVARWVRDDRRPVILTGRWNGLGTLLTSHPVRVPAASDDPFELLERVPSVEGCDEGGLPPVCGDWFGWLGYGLGRVDLDGAVLEAAHAAVALAVDGTLLLPPLD